MSSFPDQDAFELSTTIADPKFRALLLIQIIADGFMANVINEGAVGGHGHGYS